MAAGDQQRGRRFRGLLLIGLVVAAVAGIGLIVYQRGGPPGLWSEPTAGPSAPSTGEMRIQMAPEKPPPPLPKGAAGPLEVLPPDMAAAAPRPLEAPPPEQSEATPESPPGSGDPAQAVAAPPSFDCDAPVGRAEIMVCSDARLAALDRHLDRSYRRALSAGAPRDLLASQQADWRMVREDGAAISANALAQAYEQRIRELDDMVDHPPPGGW